jgi:hypothetical protein
MASRIPLVIGSTGLPQQLQAGDTLGNVAAAKYNNEVFTNGESSAALVIGTPVYVSAAGSVKRAQANAASTADVIGLWVDPTTAASSSGNCAVGGILSATTTQWDAVVTSESGGLTFDTLYYLDPANPGKLTITVPTTVGQSNVLVGRAMSTTDMRLILATAILL